jgi:hypothetical protein
MIGHWFSVSVLVVMLALFSSNTINGVNSKEMGTVSSLFGSSVQMIKSMLLPSSMQVPSKYTEQSPDAPDRPTTKPSKMTGMKVIFDSFYEEDYGVADTPQVEEQEDEAPLHEKGRLSHQRKKRDV